MRVYFAAGGGPEEEDIFEWIHDNYQTLISKIEESEIEDKLEMISGILLSVDSMMASLSENQVISKLSYLEKTDGMYQGQQ